MTNTDTSTPTPTEKEVILYCENHPNVETSLRCSKCNKPICSKCAVLTPTGYKCKECVRGQQKIFETAQPVDYPVAFIIAAVLSFLGSLLIGVIGFFVIFIAPIVGGVIAEAVRRVVNKRRSKKLFITAAVGALAGGVIRFLGGSFGFYNLLALLIPGIYIFLVVSTVYYRLSGIRM